MPTFCLSLHCRSKKPPARKSHSDPASQPTLGIRARALTLTLSLPDTSQQPEATIKQRTNLQRASPFFAKLPAEARLLIYQHVFGNSSAIHVAFDYDPHEYRSQKRPREWRWWHCACRRPEDALWWQDRCRNGYIGEAADVRARGSRKKVSVSMLFTCRRVYSESIAVLYGANTFHLGYSATPLSPLSMLLPQRVAVLSSLEIQWTVLPNSDPQRSSSGAAAYNAVWEQLAALPDLRKLKIAIICLPYDNFEPEGLDGAWLGPVERNFVGKALEVFHVAVPASYFECFASRKGGSGFRLFELPDVIREVSCFGSSSISTPN